MRKSAMLWSVLLGVLGVVLIQHVVAFEAIPLPFKPNWLRIIPVIAIWAAWGGFLIHKQLGVGARTAQAGWESDRQTSQPEQYVPMG